MIVLSFSLLIFLLVFLYWQFVPPQKQRLFLLICSIVFVFLFSGIYALYFLFLIALVYCATNLIAKNEEPKKIIFQATLFFLIGGLLFHKYFFGYGLEISLSTLNNQTRILWPLGMSYITFRLIHFTIETYRRNIPPTSFVDFASYALFFPTFLAGPIERFPNFQSQAVVGKNFEILEFNYGLYRIIIGIVKKWIIADNLARIVMPVLYYPQNYTRAIVIFSIYGLAIRTYMDFSGYADIAIGVARLFGYKIMENFNRPFLKPNIALFWRNWHISLYSFIRDYLFYPLFGYRASKTKIYLGIFASIFIFNIWHSLSFNFLISGVYFGIGLVIWYAFQELKRKALFINRIRQAFGLRFFSTLLTFSFVSFGFVFYPIEPAKIVAIIQRIF